MVIRKSHILATRHAALPVGQDEQLLIDIDLSILGSKPGRFDEYERQVRAEYNHVPIFIYRRKRKDILQEFLARSAIYSTAKLRRKFEDQARENLALSISKLGG